MRKARFFRYKIRIFLLFFLCASVYFDVKIFDCGKSRLFAVFYRFTVHFNRFFVVFSHAETVFVTDSEIVIRNTRTVLFSSSPKTLNRFFLSSFTPLP